MRRLLIILLAISFLIPMSNTQAQSTDTVWIYYVEETEESQTIWRTNAYNPGETQQLFTTPNLITDSLVDVFPENEIDALLEYAKESEYPPYRLDISFEDLLPEKTIDVEIRQIKVSPDNQELAFVVMYTHCFSLYRRPESCFGYSKIYHINSQRQITLLEEIAQNAVTKPYVACELIQVYFDTMQFGLINWTLDNHALLVTVNTSSRSSCQSFPYTKPIVILPIDTQLPSFVVGQGISSSASMDMSNRVIINNGNQFENNTEISIVEFDVSTGNILDMETYHFDVRPTYDNWSNDRYVVQIAFQSGISDFVGFIIIDMNGKTNEFIPIYNPYYESFQHPYAILSMHDNQIRMIENNQINVYDLDDTSVVTESRLADNFELLDLNRGLEILLFRDNLNGQFAIYDYQLNSLSESRLPIASENLKFIDF